MLLLTLCVVCAIVYIWHKQGVVIMTDNERKRFVTTINPRILLEFKVKCTQEQKNMNEVLEKLMEYYCKENNVKD